MKSIYKTHYYSTEEIKLIASDIKQNIPVKVIAKKRGDEFNRKGYGMLKKIRQIKRSLEKGFTYEDVINKTTTEAYNKQPEKMKQIRFYTQEELAIMKSAIRSGEPISHIANRLSKEFNRHVTGVSMKLHNLKKEIPVILKWDGPKRSNAKKILKPKLNFEPTVQQQPAEVGIDVPHGMTFEGKPKRISLHSDHFRIYF